MARTWQLDGVVLRALDLGEADRFCILFTKERGRMTARAYGVRKVGSRKGGVLLPFRHISADVHTSDAGHTIHAASDIGDLPSSSIDTASFVRLQRGVELLLVLTEDDEPLPQVFSLLLQFLAMQGKEEKELQAFQIRLLHLLGLLPAHEDDLRFQRLSPHAKAAVMTATQKEELRDIALHVPSDRSIPSFIRSVLEEVLRRPLKSDIVAGEMGEGG